MVQDEFGHLPEYREVTGTPWGVYGPYWALVEKRGKEQRRGRTTSWLLPSLSTQGPLRPNTSPGGSGNPPALRFYPKLSGTLPVSEQHGPIYQSLPLDHFETPRHVRDLIRDSEQTSVTKTHNS